MLATYLTDIERRFVERRLAEERAALEQVSDRIPSRYQFTCMSDKGVPIPEAVLV